MSLSNPIVSNDNYWPWTLFQLFKTFLNQISYNNTACAVATCCCISDEPCQWKKKILTSPRNSCDICWQIVLKLKFKKHAREASPRANLVKIGLRGGWGEHKHPVFHMFWFYPLFIFCFCILRTASWPYRWTDYDAQWLIERFPPGSTFWGINYEK